MKSDQDPALSGDSPYEEMHVPYLPLPSASLQQPASQPGVAAAAHRTPLMPNSMGENVRTKGVVAPRGKLLVSVGVILFLVVLLSASVIGGVAVYNTYMNQVNADAKATATTQAEATATATVIAANPYGGTLVLNDPLRDNSLGHWYQGSDSVSSCKFTGGAYHVSFSPGPRTSASVNAHFCMALDSADFRNFAFEVQMTIIKGDFGAILFRAPHDTAGGYQFVVGQNGMYILHSWKSPTNEQILVNSTFSSVIHPGLGQTNLIAVVAEGSTIRLYVNHLQIASVTDSTYSHGSIGLFADTYISRERPTEVVYSNAKVWVLP
jgi:eukaryotic-like serine/threonine-protein kinase